jgi:hypothetical protein
VRRNAIKYTADFVPGFRLEVAIIWSKLPIFNLANGSGCHSHHRAVSVLGEYRGRFFARDALGLVERSIIADFTLGSPQENSEFVLSRALARSPLKSHPEMAFSRIKSAGVKLVNDFRGAIGRHDATRDPQEKCHA